MAIHGLNGHCEKTWTADNGVNWVRHLLPDDLPNARIFSWGYDANTHSSSGVSCQYIYDHAKSLVANLCQERDWTQVQTAWNMFECVQAMAERLKQTNKRPILFVAHSLGGIILKSVRILNSSKA